MGFLFRCARRSLIDDGEVVAINMYANSAFGVRNLERRAAVR